MQTPLALALLFAQSFAVYSLLRYFDEKSTRTLAKRLDLQKHEVNPLLTFLARRWSLNAAFRTTWLVIASGIAAADTFLGITVSWGIPAVAFFFGTEEERNSRYSPTHRNSQERISSGNPRSDYQPGSSEGCVERPSSGQEG